MKHDRYFEDFLEDNVNLNKTRLDKLKIHKKAITDFLAEKLDGYERCSTQGSYAHKTIIKPVDDNDEFDVDILVYIRDDKFDPDVFSDYVDRVYQTFKGDGTYADKSKKNTRCVTIQYAGDFHIDIVPCIKYNDTCYICNCKNEEYEETDGDGYKKWLLEKNKIVNEKNDFRKVTKLLKYLRDYKNTFSVKSILLTTMLGNQVYDTDQQNTDFPDLPTTLRTLSNRLNKFLQEHEEMPVIKNPILSGENFNRHWGQRKYGNFRDKFDFYNSKIVEAYMEQDHDKSVKKWREIFGDNFGELKESIPENSSGVGAAGIIGTEAKPVVPAKKPWGY